MVEVGESNTLERTVDPDKTAHALGNEGVHVLGTPALINVLEVAAHQILMRHAEPGQGTVGAAVNVRHLKATPAGMGFTVTAKVTAVSGRRFRFAVEGHDEEGPILSGTHERHLIDLEAFLERARRR